MNSRNRLLTLSVCLLAFILTIAGCENGKDNNKIVGKWAYGSFVYTFNADNTCNYNAAGTNLDCTYEIKEDKLSILYKGNTETFDTKFKIEDDKLIIKDSLDNDVVYTKK